MSSRSSRPTAAFQEAEGRGHPETLPLSFAWVWLPAAAHPVDTQCGTLSTAAPPPANMGILTHKVVPHACFLVAATLVACSPRIWPWDRPHVEPQSCGS